MNKIIKTKVGDEIHYFVNGQENHGVVAKMSATYVTIFKEDGKFYQVPIDETFFVKDILINKTWDDMSMEEKTEQLQKIKAYSPRYLAKTWEQLPKELQTVLKQGAPRDVPQSKPDKILPSDDKHKTPSAHGESNANIKEQHTFGAHPKEKPFVDTRDKLTHSQSPDSRNKPGKYYDQDIQDPRSKTYFKDSEKLVRGKSPLRKALDDLNKLKSGALPKKFTIDDLKFEPNKEKEQEKKDERRTLNEVNRKELAAHRAGGKVNSLSSGKTPLGKSDVEQGVYGNVAGRPTNGLSTDTKVDAPKDYEGQSHDGIRSDQFKYEDKKPKVDDDHKNKAGEFVYSEHTPYKTKSIGVPLSQQNTWGIKYVTKEEAEKLKKEE